MTALGLIAIASVLVAAVAMWIAGRDRQRAEVAEEAARVKDLMVQRLRAERDDVAAKLDEVEERREQERALLVAAWRWLEAALDAGFGEGWACELPEVEAARHSMLRAIGLPSAPPAPAPGQVWLLDGVAWEINQRWRGDGEWDMRPLNRPDIGFAFWGAEDFARARLVFHAPARALEAA